MSKKSIIEREKTRRHLYNKYEQKRRSIKEKIKISNNFDEKLYHYSRLQKLPRNSSSSRLL